ncbi:OLC1v1018278C1 [Oldenlandia corymbosa var. corymbosa]|uniref:OLC1v1018278C1 n=1 Tax=Oldenlandia corymbosa var. corymbosa TaxID=529605 RepID=A0AAV1EB91_OLDCO|nr:OLC1v1018278C1 [Oldenlandia corymbosa var. corymbosa]
MAISDAVVGNLTTLYLAVIAGMKAYGLVSGRSFGGGFVLIVSTAVVGVILIASLTWDVSRKATYALTRNNRINHHHPSGGGHHGHEMCRGGICWHGVAVKKPASQVRFRLPPQQPPLQNRH